MNPVRASIFLFALVCTAILTASLAAQSPAAPSVSGAWLGTLHVGATSLRVQMLLDAGPPPTCNLDSLDQKAFGIACRNLKVDGSTVSLEVPDIGAHFTGILSADGKTLTGTFSQGGDFPLVLEREATPITGPPAPKPDAALPPVAVADLKTVLDRDLAAAMQSGALASSTHAAFTIGVVQHGVRRIFTYGDAKIGSVYEIGSITKTFTSLILAQMVEQKLVSLDEPVRELLPSGTVAKPADGAEITLLSLSDQHSGLPRLPDNFAPADPRNPYADYDAKLLYAFVAKHGVALPPNAPFGYSNLGVGLLGQALSERAGKPYPQLLHDEVTSPLGMTDTAIALTPSMSTRFIAGYDAAHRPAHAWDLVALAGAGAIRSTAADMLTYLEAQLHPDKLPAAGLTAKNGKTLPAAIAATHVIHADVGGNQHIALNWFHYDTGGFWHNGGTGGYSSYARFSPEGDYAIIVLCNTSPGEGSITDSLGEHIAQRLEGRPAVSLAPQP